MLLWRRIGDGSKMRQALISAAPLQPELGYYISRHPGQASEREQEGVL
jgi:hypothetical protein